MLYNTNNGQAHNNSTTCCTTNLPHRNARAQHLDMSRCLDVANFRPLVVLYNMSVAGVRVGEFGTNGVIMGRTHDQEITASLDTRPFSCPVTTFWQVVHTPVLSSYSIRLVTGEEALQLGR